MDIEVIGVVLRNGVAKARVVEGRSYSCAGCRKWLKVLPPAPSRGGGGDLELF